MFNNCTVAVHRNSLDKNFVGINTISFFSAFENLSKDAFRMFVFFAKNKNEYRFNFLLKDTKSWLNITEQQVENGIEELIEKHYLVKNNALYDFYETPLSDDEVAFFEAPRRNPLNIDF